MREIRPFMLTIRHDCHKNKTKQNTQKKIPRVFAYMISVSSKSLDLENGSLHFFSCNNHY
jgi:hypothetical protein